jgi:hypothetical protein
LASGAGQTREYSPFLKFPFCGPQAIFRPFVLRLRFRLHLNYS